MKNEIEKTQYTPTLAIFGPFSGTYHIETVGTDGDKLICTTQDKEHADLIVKAVNSHYELLEAANELVKGYEVGMGKSAIQLRIDLLKQAIQNAQ